MNDDPSTTVGTQTVVYYNVKLSKLPVQKLDVESSALDMEVGFSYTNIDGAELVPRSGTAGSVRKENENYGRY